MTIEPGHEKVLVKLSMNGTALSVEVSSPRMGTLGITNGTIHGDLLQWAVPIRSPIEIDLEFSLRVEGDTVNGESRAGSYGTSVVTGVRVAASEWTPWPAPHVHRSAVRLPDGTHVIAVVLRRQRPLSAGRAARLRALSGSPLGTPLASCPSRVARSWSPCQTRVPRGRLADLLDRARHGQRVELGCLGGHGRTGTALAWLAVLAGELPDRAVSWVRKLLPQRCRNPRAGSVSSSSKRSVIPTVSTGRQT